MAISTHASFLRIAPHFTIADVVATADYYERVLGFMNRGFFGDPPVFVMMARGAIEIYFNQDPSAANTPRPRAAVAADMYIHVSDVDALSDELKQRGASIVAGPVDRVYGMRELLVDDCNGLRIIFGCNGP
ncbi:MAG: VOC family protein [Phycisphaerales bacterium]|nr:VOC family protein [Phycisphaerales bacterium]